MVKVINVLTYSAIVIGVVFIIVAIELNAYKVVDPSGIYKYIYPYQTMSFRSLVVGIAFLLGSGVGVLVSYLNNRNENIEDSDLKEPSSTIEPVKEPVEEPVTVLDSTDEVSKPIQSTPKSKRESKLEKEVHIVERYYSYSVTCAYCGNVFDDKQTQCPKCGGAKSA